MNFDGAICPRKNNRSLADIADILGASNGKISNEEEKVNNISTLTKS